MQLRLWPKSRRLHNFSPVANCPHANVLNTEPPAVHGDTPRFPNRTPSLRHGSRPAVRLYYPDLRGRNRYVCIAMKQETGYSFIPTAYLYRRIKGG